MFLLHYYILVFFSLSLWPAVCLVPWHLCLINICFKYFALFFMVFLLRGDVSFFIVFFIKFSTPQKYKLIFINVFLNVHQRFLMFHLRFFTSHISKKSLYLDVLHGLWHVSSVKMVWIFLFYGFLYQKS